MDNQSRDSASEHIEQLRKYRGRRERAWDIQSLIAGTQRELLKDKKRGTEFVDLWRNHLPPQIEREARIVSIRGGIVTVEVTGSSVAYELDRMLRDGLLADLRRAYRGSLRSIRLRVTSSSDPAPQR